MRGVLKFGLVLLGIWLILIGLETFVSFKFIGADILGYIKSGLAIVAGVCIIIGKTK